MTTEQMEIDDMTRTRAANVLYREQMVGVALRKASISHHCDKGDLEAYCQAVPHFAPREHMAAYREIGETAQQWAAGLQRAYYAAPATGGYLGDVPGLLLLGTVGCGKSILAAATLTTALSTCAGMSGLFCGVSDLLAEIRRRFGTHEDADEPIRDAIEVDLLVLDDVGIRNVWRGDRHDDWIEETYYRIIDGRLARGVPTIATSNAHNAGELVAAVGERAASRIIRHSGQIEFSDIDLRRAAM